MTETVATSAPTTGKGANKRLTPEAWEQVKAKWRSGLVTLAQLSEEYGVGEVGLSRRLKKHGVVKGSDAETYERKVAEARAAAAAEAAKQEEKELRDTAAGLKKLLLMSSNHTARQLMKAMANNTSSGVPLAAILEDAKAAKEVTNVFKNIADTIDRVVPGASPLSEELPELRVTELTPREIADLQRQQEELEAEFGNYT